MLMMCPRRPMTWTRSCPFANSKTGVPSMYARFDVPSLRIVAMRTAALNFSVTIRRRTESLRRDGLYITICGSLRNPKASHARAFPAPAFVPSRTLIPLLHEERVHRLGRALSRRHRVRDARAAARVNARPVRPSCRRIRLKGAVLPHLEPEVQWNALEVRLLTHGDDRRVAPEHDGGRVRRYRLPAAALVRRPKDHLLELDSLEALQAEEPCRGDEELKPHALRHGLLDLLIVRGHLLSGPPVQDRDFLRPVPKGGASAVHRDIPTADDDDPGPDGHAFPALRFLQVFQCGQDAIEVLSRDSEALRLLGSESNEDGIVLLEKVLDVEIIREGHVEAELDREGPEAGHVLLEHPVRQAVRRDRARHETAEAIRGLEDGDLVAPLPEDPGDHETRRTAADDGDALPVRRHRRSVCRRRARELQGGSLQLPDRDGVALLGHGTRALAVMVADPSK